MKKPSNKKIRWSTADDKKSVPEGWAVFDIGDGVFEIERIDDPGIDMPDDGKEYRPVFESDLEALMFVYEKAVRENSAFHRRALLFTLQER